MTSRTTTVAQWERMVNEFEEAIRDQSRVVSLNNTPYNQGWKRGFVNGLELSRRNLRTAQEQTFLHRLVFPVPAAKTTRTLLMSTLEALIRDHKESPRTYISADPKAFNEGLAEGLLNWVESYKLAGHVDKRLVRKLRRK